MEKETNTKINFQYRWSKAKMITSISILKPQDNSLWLLCELPKVAHSIGALILRLQKGLLFFLISVLNCDIPEIHFGLHPQNHHKGGWSTSILGSSALPKSSITVLNQVHARGCTAQSHWIPRSSQLTFQSFFAVSSSRPHGDTYAGRQSLQKEHYYYYYYY